LYIKNILLLESSEALKHERNIFTAYKKPKCEIMIIPPAEEEEQGNKPTSPSKNAGVDRSQKYSLNFLWKKGPGGVRGNLQQQMLLELLPNTIIRLTAWATGVVMFMGAFSPLWARFQKSLSPMGPSTLVDNSAATYIFNEPIVVAPITGVAGGGVFEVWQRHFQHAEGVFDAFVFSPQLIRIDTTSVFDPTGVQIGQTMRFLGKHFEMVKGHLMAKDKQEEKEGEDKEDPKMAVFKRWKEVNLGTMDKLIEPLDLRFNYEDSEKNVQSTFEMSKDVDIAVSVQEFFLITCLAAEWRLSRKQEPALPAPVQVQPKRSLHDSIVRIHFSFVFAILSHF
jgi:hypothetical protein